jgi:hypothetical protein
MGMHLTYLQYLPDDMSEKRTENTEDGNSTRWREKNKTIIKIEVVWKLRVKITVGSAPTLARKCSISPVAVECTPPHGSERVKRHSEAGDCLRIAGKRSGCVNAIETARK